MEPTITKANDPVHEEERKAYGVLDTEGYIFDLKERGVKPHREYERTTCVVCEGHYSKRNKAVHGPCETRDGVECNCCPDHRKNCILSK